MATGKIRADTNFRDPYPHAKIRARARARNPRWVETQTRTRCPRIPAYPWARPCTSRGTREGARLGSEVALAWVVASGRRGMREGVGGRCPLSAGAWAHRAARRGEGAGRRGLGAPRADGGARAPAGGAEAWSPGGATGRPGACARGWGGAPRGGVGGGGWE